MARSTNILMSIFSIFISLNIIAQRNQNGNSPQTQEQSTRNNTNAVKRRGPNWGSNVSISFGGYSSSYGNNYGNNYGYGYQNNSYYSVKKASRNAIRQAAGVIGEALQFSDWNDIYSPWLAKAIRHQQYAKQLYFWGDYAGALNHSERAGFLAWNTLSYFNNSYSNNNTGYPNPYGDPNNPYYRQNNPNDAQQQQNGNDEDYEYRSGSNGQTSEPNSSIKRESQPATQRKINKTELDVALPQSRLNDRELLKVSSKDLNIE